MLRARGRSSSHNAGACSSMHSQGARERLRAIGGGRVRSRNPGARNRASGSVCVAGRRGGGHLSRHGNVLSAPTRVGERSPRRHRPDPCTRPPRPPTLHDDTKGYVLASPPLRPGGPGGSILRGHRRPLIPSAIPRRNARARPPMWRGATCVPQTTHTSPLTPFVRSPECTPRPRKPLSRERGYVRSGVACECRRLLPSAGASHPVRRLPRSLPEEGGGPRRSR
jgi:hypothetical protein